VRFRFRWTVEGLPFLTGTAVYRYWRTIAYSREPGQAPGKAPAGTQATWSVS